MVVQIMARFALIFRMLNRACVLVDDVMATQTLHLLYVSQQPTLIATLLLPIVSMTLIVLVLDKYVRHILMVINILVWTPHFVLVRLVSVRLTLIVLVPDYNVQKLVH